MAFIDILIWVLAGLLAGGFVGASWPSTPLGLRCSVLTAAVVGAGTGGWITQSYAGLSAVAFLGAVCGGVLAAVLSMIVLWRIDPTRFPL